MATTKRESFLSILDRSGGDHFVGDQYGGADGADGSGAPTGEPGNFMFATGIECSNPTIEHGKVRRDQLDECGHYRHFKKDFALVKELGLKVLRYGLPYHRIHRGPSRYDWSFADEAMNEIRRLGITPILDLLHFGVPDWLGDFQNPELPIHFARYAEAVAKRYPWVRFYTPVNEIFVTAKLSAKEGLWNEQLKTDRGFVTALKHCVAASILATHRIARHRPDCVIVQSESAEYVHEARANPSPGITLQNKLRFASLDLLYAHPPDADVFLYLTENGLTRAEYDWFMRGEPPGYQVMGNDYYGKNERILLPDGTLCEAEDVLGWYQMTRRYYDRYRKPTMHTETNHFDPERAPIWLWKQWFNILQMRKVGVPVLGFTWYSLTDQIDWDSALARNDGHVNACGLFDLERNERPVARAYRDPPARIRPDHDRAEGRDVRADRTSVAAEGRDMTTRGVSLVLLHLFGGSGREWDGVSSLFDPKVRVFAPDLPGFGDAADEPPGGAKVMADRVDALIRDEGIESCVLVGHSMSAKVVLVLAARKPAYLRALVLVAGSPPSPEPMSVDARRALMAFDFSRNAAERHVDDLTTRRLPDAIRERAIEDAMRTSRDAWFGWVRDGSREDLSALIGVVDVPTLVVAASGDPSLGAVVQHERVMPHLSNGKLVVVDGGHALPLENPVAVQREIDHFVASLTG